MGRPPFKPTDDQRRQVAIATACGMSHDDIALALGVSKPTLRRRFRRELDTGGAARRLEVLSALHDRAIAGSVAAIKAWLLISAAAIAPAAGSKPARLGKKEAANIASGSAAEGTEWEGILPVSKTVQ